MAQRSIVWSKEAQKDFLATLKYYKKRNGNNIYSKSLSKEVKTGIKRLKEYPFLGRATDDESIRILNVNKFRVYYELKKEIIFILFIWDTRRNIDDIEKNLFD